jgi:hypothetical protein
MTPQKNFSPISHLANVPLGLLINPQLPARDTKEFIGLLRSNPGKYDFASSGAGAPLTSLPNRHILSRKSVIHSFDHAFKKKSLAPKLPDFRARATWGPSSE